MPGEVLATEEEYIPGLNAYVENGHIYAAVDGTVSIDGGIISVLNAEKNISPIKEGMYVLGFITDDIRTVQFVKLDDITVNERKFVAMKNGKIVARRRREGMSSEEPPKEFAAGDVVLARIDNDKEDTYELDMFGREMGVVNANCAFCGRTLEYMEDTGKLHCSACKLNEYRRVSSFYGDTERIAEEIRQHALNPIKRQRPPRAQFGSRPPFRRGGGFHSGPRDGHERRDGPGGYRPRFDRRGGDNRDSRSNRDSRFSGGSRDGRFGGESRERKEGSEARGEFE